MLAHAIFFYIFSFIAIISAIMVTVSKNTEYTVFLEIVTITAENTATVEKK